MNVLALDIETKNYAHEIGGWNNTHLFQVSTVCTYDGNHGTVYIDKPIGSIRKSNVTVKPLKQLKFDLDAHRQDGGVLLGHNIVNFDLAVLKNAMDIYCIKEYLDKKAYIDTSRLLTKQTGEHYGLDNLCQNTMNVAKLMSSSDAPKVWKAGKYTEVADYCLKDTEMVYDLWIHGKENNIVKGFSIKEEKLKELEVNW